MQLAVYLDRALGRWKRDSCRLNYYIEIGSLLEWPRFAYDAGCVPQRAMLLLFVHASNSSTPLAIATFAYQSSYRIAVIYDLYEYS